MPVPTEAQEGRILVAYLRTRNFRFTHIPNETGGTWEAQRRAGRMKMQGTSRGFPDYIVLLPEINALLAIELKRQDGSRTSAEQHEWIEAFCEIGNCEGIIAKGAKDAIDYIENLYANVKPKPQETVDPEPF